MFGFGKKTAMPEFGNALPGRGTAIATAETHFGNDRPLKGPHPAGLEQAMFGMFGHREKADGGDDFAGSHAEWVEER